ncbi:hypothetical protein TGRUB_270805 [Toxoplasma gondii RUB]|uniref:Uncharacterized protein n=1 Tax=Toxoplasma gondii RUB TaxID=935652 RepID=A0A086LYC7_TOXGO|nr:hypothetical protein TGRUB_270805 [Toxoplasma gondii RUB]
MPDYKLPYQNGLGPKSCEADSTGRKNSTRSNLGVGGKLHCSADANTRVFIGANPAVGSLGVWGPRFRLTWTLRSRLVASDPDVAFALRDLSLVRRRFSPGVFLVVSISPFAFFCVEIERFPTKIKLRTSPTVCHPTDSASGVQPGHIHRWKSWRRETPRSAESIAGTAESNRQCARQGKDTTTMADAFAVLRSRAGEVAFLQQCRNQLFLPSLSPSHASRPVEQGPANSRFSRLSAVACETPGSAGETMRAVEACGPRDKISTGQKEAYSEELPRRHLRRQVVSSQVSLEDPALGSASSSCSDLSFRQQESTSSFFCFASVVSPLVSAVC